VTNEESLNALKVQLAVQIFPNEKVTIRPTERPTDHFHAPSYLVVKKRIKLPDIVTFTINQQDLK